jgi:hypothetical protein
MNVMGNEGWSCEGIGNLVIYYNILFFMREINYMALQLYLDIV